MNTKTNKNQTIIRIVLTIAILILINIISIRFFCRLDLTANSLYTLSDASIDLVENLDDRISVEAYFSEDLPAPYNNNRRALLDMLNEYRAYGGSNIQYEFINPEGEEGENEARTAGIPPVEIQVVEEDKVEVKRAYLGLVMRFEDRKETIPVLQDLSSLEYDLSSAFKRLTQEGKKQIGFVSGHSEADINKLQIVGAAIARQYDIIPVDLSTGAEIPDGLSALFIIDPKTVYSDSAKYAIDQFLMGGGRLAVLNGKIKVDFSSPNPSGQVVEVGLNDMLANYGVRINADLIRDEQCMPILVARRQGQFTIRNQVNFPYIPRITNLNKDVMIVGGLQSLVLPFVSSIDSSLASALNVKAEVIASSSEKSGRNIGPIMVNPFYEWSAVDFPEKNIPAAILFKGKFNSFYTGKYPAAKLTKSPETIILAVGSGTFMSDEMTQQSRENLAFFANIVDYLADDSGLISIRSKDVSIPQLEEITDGTRKTLKYGNMALPPIMIILYGLFRWRKRVAIKNSIEAQL